jgi:hypothetical protein
MDKNNGVIGLIYDLASNVWRIWIRDYIKPLNPYEIQEVSANGTTLALNYTYAIHTNTTKTIYLPPGVDGSFIGLQDFNAGLQPITLVVDGNDKINGDTQITISGSYWTYELIFYSGTWRVQ